MMSEFQNQSRIKNARQAEIDNTGTAPLAFLNAGDITATGGNIIDFTEEAKTAKHYPFDFASVNNSSSSDLNVYINQRADWVKKVRAGTILNIKDFKGVRTIRLQKVGAGTIAAGEVEVSVMKMPLTDDEAVRRNAKQPFFVKLFKAFVSV